MEFFVNHKEVRGAVAILLVVVMLPMMTLSAFMVDTARYNLAKSMVSSAGDLTMNAALADYDTILKDVYGLFAMSQEDDVEENVKSYFKQTLVDYGVVDEDDAEDYVSSLLGSVYEYLVVEDKETVDFLTMTVNDTDLKVSKVGGAGSSGSGLDNPDILEKQIVEYMKYRAPVDFGLSFVDSLSAFTKINDQAEVLETQVIAQEKMGDVTEANKALYDAVKKYDDKYRELEPEGASADELHLKTYGKRLNSYEERYQQVNRLAIIFCLSAKTGKWDISGEDLKRLNNGGDYIVLDGEGAYSIPTFFSDGELTEAMFADADEFMEGLYNGVKASSVSSALGAYGAARFNHAWDWLSGPDAMTDEVIADFQKTDSFYKSSDYDKFLAAAEQVDYFARAAQMYASRAEDAIGDIDDKIEEIEEKLKSTTLSSEEKASLEEDKAKQQEEKEDYESAKDDVDGKLQEVLGLYRQSLNNYNSDIRKYGQCVKEVKDCVAVEVAGIAMEMRTIQNNLIELKNLLVEVETKLGQSQKQVEVYMGSVEKWKDSNEKYKEGGGDSFSEGNSADITEAENTFDLDDIQELLDAAADERVKVENCISQIESNFIFHGTHISFIISADEALSAVAGGPHGGDIGAYRSSGEISKAECDSFFEYYGEVDERFLDDLKQLATPYPCCRFMHYLYQTYGRDNQSGLSEEEKDEAEANKDNYNKLKDGSNTASSDAEQESGSKYGYTYDGKSIGGEGFPSNGGNGEEVSSAKSNDSSGISENKSIADNILGGLANAMETGRDKLLVTSYLFENFSYNTLVQDLAREGLEDEGKKSPSWINSAPDVYADYLDAAATVSNIKINAKNNYLYGAEIEYILFGNSDAAKNVTTVKASIFAIRFLFNAVFAFTDSSVRNETRAVALAVQAASMGIIPYQLVQAVLQIALAMGESAIDLANMNAGAKVAVVKTKDTWTLSIKGLSNLAKGALETAAEKALDKAVECLNDKLAEITDAAADELAGAVEGLGDNLEQCVNSAAEEVLNSLTAQINAAVDSALSNAAYIADTDISSINENVDAVKAYAKGQVENAFSTVKTDVHSLLDTAAGSGSSVKEFIAGRLSSYIDGALEDVKGGVIAKIDSASNVEDVRTYMYEQAYQVKDKVGGKINEKVGEILGGAKDKFQDKINEVNTYVKEQAAEASEVAKGRILEKVNGFVDEVAADSTKFIDDALSDNNLSNINGNAVTSSSKAAMIRFGYSDYLKLFVFIGLCASNKSGDMMKRIADVIQINIAQAGEGSDLRHKKGEEFKMSNAKTYVSIEAKVELELMFLNLGVFRKQVETYNAELEEEEKMDLSSTLTIDYIGIAGY